MMTTRNLVLTVCVLAIGSVWMAQALAQPSHIEIMPVVPPNILIPSIRPHGFRVDHEKAVKITDVDVRIDILEMTATTTVEFSLENQTARRQEAQVMIPVPDGAVVRGFAYDGPHGEITAKVLSKEEARRIYQGLVAKMRDPALVEFVGYNLIQSSVFPIEPRGRQKVRLTYEHLLDVQGNRVDYVLPRTESLDYEVPWTISATIKSKQGVSTVYCPSHTVYTHRESGREVSIKIEVPSQKQPGAFRLSYLMKRDGVAASLFAYPDTKVGGGYFLLLAGVPAQASDSLEVQKREVTLVIDRSGSMRNEKIKQVKEAALQVIAGLKPGEAFNVLVYSNNVESFSVTPVIKTDKTEEAARQYIEGLTATGGTNIYDALKSALEQQPTQGMLPIVLFLTDGLPTVGQRSEMAIRELAIKANPFKRRVFTIGVGFDVNAPLLDKLAEVSRGKSETVLPNEDVEAKVGMVFKRLTGPVLADTELVLYEKDGSRAQGRTRDILPAVLPDLFESDQLVLLGQYVGDRPLTFEIKGTALGKPKTYAFTFDFDQAHTRNGFVPRLWASRKIAELIDLIRQMGADSSVSGQDPKVKELTDEIVRLSTEFGILTEYTAFLAQEGTDLNDPVSLYRDAASNFESRAMRVRSGMGGMNQSSNLSAQKMQTQLNYDNGYFNEQMERVRITSVQQINDLAFFNRNHRWVDSRLADRGSDVTPDRTVEFGSDAYFRLAEQLAAQGRQGSIAFDADVLLWIDGQAVLVKNVP
jgi:Ca-activated chloride channel family protein